MKCKYIVFMLSLLVSYNSYTYQLFESETEYTPPINTYEPYIPVYVDFAAIFNGGYSEWVYMLSREKSACNKYCEATINPINITDSIKALEEYQSELEELVRYRRMLLQKLITVTESVADWYNADSIILFYNSEYMWINPNNDITREVINELNDYHEYINQLISIHEQPDNKNNTDYNESKNGN